MKVRDVMSATPFVVREGESCQEAAAMMCRHRVRHLPVLDRDGLLAGVITDRDLRHYLLSTPVVADLGRLSASALLKQAPVADVMSSPAFVTSPGTELPEAVAIMRDRRLGSLPVVEGRRLVGILTETDLLRKIVATEPAEDDGGCIVVSYP